MTGRRIRSPASSVDRKPARHGDSGGRTSEGSGVREGPADGRRRDARDQR